MAASRWDGVLALELLAGESLQDPLLNRAEADRLGPWLARQLSRYLPSTGEFGMAWAAAAFDPAELLRPGFPVHEDIAALFKAQARGALGGGQILTLARGPDGMPAPRLMPRAELGGGQLVAIPVVLLGPAEALALARERLESELLDSGLADPDIVLPLSKALRARFEHVRWMSLMDLLAMTGAQLAQVGFEAAFALVEHALLAADERLHGRSRSGLVLSWADRQAWIDFHSFGRYAAGQPRLTAEARLVGWLEQLQEFRQIQALLRAHGLESRIGDPRQQAEHVCSRQRDEFLIDEIDPAAGQSWLRQEDASLGVVAFSLLDHHGCPLAHWYPMSAEAIAAFLRADSPLRGGLPIQRGPLRLSADGLDLGGITPSRAH